MKITIEPETTQEQTAMKEPMVRTGLEHVGLTARCGPNSVTFSHGGVSEIIGGLSRMIEELRIQAIYHSTVNAVIEAHHRLVEEAQSQEIAGKVMNGRHLRLQQ